jgi:hypothetical protein
MMLAAELRQKQGNNHTHTDTVSARTVDDASDKIVYKRDEEEKDAGEHIMLHSHAPKPNVEEIEAARRERMEFYTGLGMGADEARLLVQNLIYNGR